MRKAILCLLVSGTFLSTHAISQTVLMGLGNKGCQDFNKSTNKSEFTAWASGYSNGLENYCRDLNDENGEACSGNKIDTPKIMKIVQETCEKEQNQKFGLAVTTAWNGLQPKDKAESKPAYSKKSKEEGSWQNIYLGLGGDKCSEFNEISKKDDEVSQKKQLAYMLWASGSASTAENFCRAKEKEECAGDISFELLTVGFRLDCMQNPSEMFGVAVLNAWKTLYDVKKEKSSK